MQDLYAAQGCVENVEVAVEFGDIDARSVIDGCEFSPGSLHIPPRAIKRTCNVENALNTIFLVERSELDNFVQPLAREDQDVTIDRAAFVGEDEHDEQAVPVL